MKNLLFISLLLSAAVSNAQVKITDMPTLDAKPTTAYVPIVIGGINKKVRADSIASLAKTDSAAIRQIVHDSLASAGTPENGLFKETNKIKLGGPLTITETRIYDSSGTRGFEITNKGGSSNPSHTNYGGYMRITPYLGTFGSAFRDQYSAENILGMRTMPYFKQIDFGINGSALSIDSLNKITLHGYANNADEDSLLTTDASGKMKHVQQALIYPGAGMSIYDSTVDGKAVKVFSATGVTDTSSSVLPYYEYVAIVNNGGSDPSVAPTIANVLYNDIPGTLSWSSHVNDYDYQITSDSSAFTNGKTLVILGNPKGGPELAEGFFSRESVINSTSMITVKQYGGGQLLNCNIIIRVYK